MRYRISKKEDFYVPLYDWYRYIQTSYDGEGQIHWNNPMANVLKCNWINVFPSGGSRDGTRKMPGAFLLDTDRINEYTKKSLEESHENGIKVMTSAPIAEVFEETWLDWGIDPTDMLTVDADGKRVKRPNGLHHACNNSPKWKKFLIEYTEKVAKAGFDGCLYDGYTYAYEPGYYCCCDDCKASWKAFCLDLFGEEKPMPDRFHIVDKTDVSEVDRAFVLWRLRTQSDVYNDLRAAGRKYVPGFEVYINSTIYDISLSFFYLNGLDVTSSEFKHLLGHENSSFMYNFNEALTDKQLISFTNVFERQFRCLNEYYVEVATAFANGGAMCETEVSRTKPMDYYVTDFTKRLGKILDDDRIKFKYSGNIAEAAILYSWRDEVYYQAKGFGDFYKIGATNVRELYHNCSARRTAVNLARAGIPYSYIVSEKAPSKEDLAYNKTIIIPELTLLDKDLEDKLFEYVGNGGNIVITGEKFAENYSLDENAVKIEKRDYDVLEKWTGTAYAKAADYQEFTVGNGKVIVSKKYVTNLEKELESGLTDSMFTALKTTGAADQVRIEAQPKEGYCSVSLRANAAGSQLYLHLVNYDIGDDYKGGEYTVSTKIPDGATVTDVEVQSPCFADTDEIGLKWEVRDGRVFASGNFNIYSYLTIKLSYND